MPEEGYIYIVQGVDTQYVKVGKSTNPLERIKTLEQGLPFPLRILLIRRVADMDREEKVLLHDCEPYRTRGEWCALSPTHIAMMLNASLVLSGGKAETTARLKPHERTWLLERLCEDAVLDVFRVAFPETPDLEAVMQEVFPTPTSAKGSDIYTMAHTLIEEVIETLLASDRIERVGDDPHREHFRLKLSPHLSAMTSTGDHEHGYADMEVPDGS